MNLPIDLDRQQVLDEAIRLLYQSRPAKAAALLGLLEQPSEPISLGDKLPELPPVATKQANLNMMGQGIPGAGPSMLSNSYQSVSGFGNGTNSSPTQDPIANVATKVKDDLTGTDLKKSPGQLGNNISASSQMGSVAKTAMTAEEAMYYTQMGIDPSSIPRDSSLPLSPMQMAGIGGGGASLYGANRLRASNVSTRELKDIRNKYLEAANSGSLDKKTLKLLNKELKLRGSKPLLRAAETAGIADAYMRNAEKQMANNILKTRYRGVMPLLASTLLGTVAYNKINKD